MSSHCKKLVKKFKKKIQSRIYINKSKKFWSSNHYRKNVRKLSIFFEIRKKVSTKIEKKSSTTLWKVILNFENISKKYIFNYNFPFFLNFMQKIIKRYSIQWKIQISIIWKKNVWHITSFVDRKTDFRCKKLTHKMSKI